MSYTVLARRYRSQSFGEVVGQEPIAQTLRSAIELGRVHHAYLFCGTRGVGKTSMARIFARALNAPDTMSDCPKSGDYDDYPPMDVQERMSDAIMRGDDLNVIEIDGASNRGIDDARQLIANAGLAPTENARFKVYIIDEVHMLTSAAFNVLLKTMEEPPSHLKWILCTTEPEKVLATIQSRCQRFDFRNISTGAIADHLRKTLVSEKIEADDALVFQVAKHGDGSIRDALSLLDRLLAAGEEKLTVELLERMLGLPNRELMERLVDAVIASDVGRALVMANEILNGGISLDQFIVSLIEYLRQLMLIAACGKNSELIEADEASKEKLAEQAKGFDVAGLIYQIALCENVHKVSRRSSTARALVDAMVARMALSEQFANIATLAAGAVNVDDAKKKVVDEMAGTRRAVAERSGGNSGNVGNNGVMRGGISGGIGEMRNNVVEVNVGANDKRGNNEGIGGGVWEVALEKTRNVASMSWIRSLDVVTVDGDMVKLRLNEEGRGRGVFVQSRIGQLSDLLTELAGRRMRVVIDDAGNGDNGNLSAGNGQRVTQEEKDKAMRMPLVKQVVDLFGATLLELRKADGKG